MSEMQLSDDWTSLEDGARIVLHPNDANPLHKKPQVATYNGGYFYCDGSDPMDGPDYYFGDVAAYCEGFAALLQEGEGGYPLDRGADEMDQLMADRERE